MNRDTPVNMPRNSTQKKKMEVDAKPSRLVSSVL